jgi:hypothetical protein
VPNSAAGGRSSGRLGQSARSRSPQICRTPSALAAVSLAG